MLNDLSPAINPKSTFSMRNKNGHTKLIITPKINVTNISGGQAQRIAFIRTLLFKRPLFLFDEVTSSVDEKIRDVMWQEISAEKDITLICVTHDKEFAKNLDSIITLR